VGQLIMRYVVMYRREGVRAPLGERLQRSYASTHVLKMYYVLPYLFVGGHALSHISDRKDSSSVSYLTAE